MGKYRILDKKKICGVEVAVVLLERTETKIWQRPS